MLQRNWQAALFVLVTLVGFVIIGIKNGWA